jgi:uncharacterized membrane protein YhaH (DUF805 family)
MFRAYKRYFDFRGRAGRKEYWLFILWMLIGGIVAACVDMMVFGAAWAYGSEPFTPAYWAFSLANLIPCLAVGFRRLHDTGRSAWWLLIMLIPVIGFIVLIVFYATKGDPGANRFGPPDGEGLASEPEPRPA